MKYADSTVKMREYVNKNQSKVYSHFTHNSNEHHWNILCSCMDWIKEAARYIDSNPLKFKDNMTIEFYSYISSIDIIHESVKQLNRIINNGQNLPFFKNKDIFNDTLWNKNDAEYFKHLRAIFGAHPVNLKSNNDDGRYFASWPKFVSNNLVQIFLYPKNLSDKEVLLQLNPKSLEEFLDQLIMHIDTLTKKIQEQIREEIDKAENINIPDDLPPLEKIKLLIDYSSKVLNYDYYVETLKEIEFLLTIETTESRNNKFIKMFKDELLMTLNEIEKNLKEKKQVDLVTTNNWDINPNSEIAYTLGKLTDLAYETTTRPFFEKKMLLDFFKENLYVDKSMTNKELYLLTKVSLYIDNRSKRD